MLRISRGVVCATGRGQSVSPSSPRLLVVTGQGLCQVPMSYKSAKLIRTLAFANLTYEANTIFYLQQWPHLTLALSIPIPKLMVATITRTFPCIHSFWTSVRSPDFRPTVYKQKSEAHLSPDPFLFSSPTTYMEEKSQTCMISLGQDSKLG